MYGMAQETVLVQLTRYCYEYFILKSVSERVGGRYVKEGTSHIETWVAIWALASKTGFTRFTSGGLVDVWDYRPVKAMK